MNFKTKYKLMLFKKYVDRGRSVTSYFNELILLFGAWTIFTYQSFLNILALILGYGLFVFVVGWIYYNYGWELAEQEVGNQFNLFQQEIRNKLNIKRKI